MRILCMLPAAEGVYPKEAEERRLNLMRSYARPGTEIVADYMPGLSGFVPWGNRGDARPEGAVERANEFAAQRAAQAEEEGYDAFCPYGLRDFGVREARQRVKKILVIGQAEAAALFCGLLGRPFASCQYMPGGEEATRQHTVEMGVGHLYVAATAIGIPNSEYPTRRKELRERFVACAQEARAKGAELMGHVAMSICPGEYPAAELAAASGLPVLDALACQIALAEWWHRVGIPPSLLRIPRAAP